MKRRAEKVNRVLLCFPNAPPTTQQIELSLQAQRTSQTLQSNLPLLPTATAYLEGLTYPHYRVQVVAMVTEKKLILSVRDSTDVDIHLGQQEWGQF